MGSSGEDRRSPEATRFGEILLYVLGFLAAVALAAFLIVWLLRVL